MRSPRVIGVILLASVAGGYIWMRADGDDLPERIETATVRRETLERTVSATGAIRPIVGAEINVGSRVSGIVRRIEVRVGDSVSPGDVLARLDPTEMQAEVDQARADLALAEAELATAARTHERQAVLAGEGIVSPTELDLSSGDLGVARARVDLQRARLQSAEIRLGYTEIRAPVGGVIAEVTTREGETVAASLAAPTFVTIVDLERLEVQAYVDETDIGRVFVGQQASFSVDTYPDHEIAATVTAINPRAAMQNGVVNYVVLLDFDRPAGVVLRPEMTTHVRLALDRRVDALTLPRTAVRRDDGHESVIVEQQQGRWVERRITTGWRTDDRVEIVAGLDEGEIVRLNPR